MMNRLLARAAIWPTGFAVLLALVATAELLAPVDLSPDAPPPRQTAAAAPVQTDAGSLAGAWSNTILARPIFRPDRRPLEAAPAAPAEMPRLTAIVITAAGARAIFVDDGGTATSVKAGGEVDGEKVKSITATGVTLTGPTGLTILRPQYVGAPAAAPAAPGGQTPPSGIPSNVDRF